MKSIWKSVALVACTGLAISSAHARPDFPETEPNDTKAAANAVTLAVGDSVSGTSTGTSTTVAGAASADYYRVKTTAAPLGIYRHRLALSSTTQFQTATIRGLSQTSPGVIGTGDNTAQTHSTTLVAGVRTVQWYGFGKQEEIYYRVTGTTTTLSSYTSTLATDPVVPFDFTAATIYAGNVTIGPATGNTADMDWWLYDGSLNAIPCAGMDTGPTAGVRTVSLTPGTYYLAFSSFAFANNQASCSPETFFGTVLDFPNAASLSSTSTTITNINAKFTSTAGVVETAGLVQDQPFKINWIQFTVVAAPVVSGAGTATPASVGQGGSTEFAVSVIPGGSGTLDDIANPPQLSGVRVDVAQVSGNSSPDWLYLVRDGITANWKSMFMVPVTTTPAAYVLPFEITQTGMVPSTFSGNINLTVTPPPPANDPCTGATVIASVPFTSTLIEYGSATTDTNANPSCDTSANTAGANRGVWWSYTPASNGIMTVRRDSPTSEDTVTSVWTGANCGALTQVPTNGCVDGDATAFPITVTGGTTYFIMVSKWSDATPATGTMVGVTVDFVPPLANDDCTGAIALSVGVPVTSSNATATSTGDGVASGCQASVKNGVWYSFTTGPVAETYLFNTCSGAAHDTVLTVFNAGVDCTGISTASNILVCNDDDGPGCTGTRASVTAGLAANSTYLVRLQTWNSGTSGPYTIEVTIPAPIDACCNNTTGVCTPIIAGTCPTGSTSTGMTSCSPSPCAVISTCCNNTSGVCTTIYGGSCPTGTTAGTGLVCDAMTCPAIATCCNDTSGACSIIYGGSCPTGSSQVDTLGTCTPNPCPPSGSCCTGTACSVILDTNSASCTGTYTVNGVCSPVNPCFPADNCATTDLIASMGANSGSTVNATTSYLITPVSLCPGITTSSGGYNDIYLKFTAPATAAYTLDTCAVGSFDTILSIHSGTCATIQDSASVLACNDDSSATGNVGCTTTLAGSSNLNSRIQSVNLSAGVQYYIRISSFGATTTGAYTLNINYVTGVGSCCVSTTCSLTDAANCSGTFNAGGSCSPSPCVPSTENCCRGTTCNSITAGTCTGVVAGSNSLVVTSCGAGNALSTCCFADYNHDGIQSIDDLFLYFNAYFTASPWANVGGDGVATPTIDDLFLYINAYFSTCAP